jgi:hypothetical protein
MGTSRRYFLKSTGTLALCYGIRPLRALAAVGAGKADSKREELYKDIVKDFGAKGDGMTSDARAFNSFSAWAIKQTQPIRLNLPPGNYVLDTQKARCFAQGIKRLVVDGHSASLSFVRAGGIGLPTNNLHSARIASVSAGSRTVKLLSRSDSSKFGVGGWIAIAAFDMMGWGYPQNPWYFEYRKVTAINPSTGVITLDAELHNDYLSTYPLHNAGGPHSPDMGGPATIFTMDASWDTEVIFRGVTFAQANQDIYGSARSIQYIDCKFPIRGPAPSQAQHWRAVRTDLGPYVEVDKNVELLDLDDITCTSRNGMLHFQSASIENCVIRNSRIHKLMGTAKHMVIKNSDVRRLTIGASAFGNTLSLLMENCAIGAVVGSTSQRRAFAPASVVNGTLTIPLKPAINTFVPGGKMFFTGGGGQVNFGTPFICTDVRSDGTSVFFDTTLPSNFSVPLDKDGKMWVTPHPCPNVTVRDCHGCPDIVNLSYAPAGRPLFEYARITLTGDFASVGRMTVWGALVKLRVNVIRPYTGALSTLNLNALGQFGAGIVGVDGFTLSKWNPIINLKIAGERVITPGAFTGDQTGDSNLSIEPIWFYNGFQPFLSGDIGADSQDKRPTVEIELITDQGMTATQSPKAERRF